MVNYEKIFEPYYEGGWEAYPLETTLVTAGALNAYDAAIMHIEDYLDTQVDPNDNLAETYDDTATYEVGDYCVYNGVLYKCITAIDEAEEFDPTKWESCLITDEMATSGGTTVIANPVGTPTDDLETIQIGNTIYDIPGGGGGNANIWTGTQAEYEAQASQIADDTVVLITDDEERTQAFEVYSTDEQVIGTWIDGSTLYRKTLTGDLTPSGTSYSEIVGTLSSLGATFVTKAEGFLQNTVAGGLYKMAIPSYVNSTNASGVYITGTGDIKLYVTGTYHKYYLTLEYIK